jgi:hypothetical protein
MNNPMMSITDANFSQVRDNGGVGVSLAAATMEKPWTMDEGANVQWQYRIEKGSGQYYESDWSSLAIISVSSVDLSTAIGNASAARNVQLRYKDALENTGEWFDVGVKVSYYDAVFDPISTWDASYNPDANTISLNWTNPTQSDFKHVELAYTVNGGAVQRLALGETAESYTITNVPRLTTSGVQDGAAVSGIYEYAVTLEAHSISGMKSTGPFKIWNFGTPGLTDSGMSVSNLSPAEEIRTQGELAAMETGNANKKYVLANDISLTAGWTPIGNSSTNAFRGTFYGSGHTITFAAGVALGGSTYRGLFGYAEDAEIRDLTVKYANVSTTSSGAVYLGGVAGYAGGSARILNVITVDLSGGGLTLTNNGSGETYFGGFAGKIDGAATINNSRSGLSMNLNSTASGNTYAGGAAGYSDTTGTFEKVQYSGTLTITSAAGTAFLGGLAGESRGTGMTGCRFSGKISFSPTYNSNQELCVGGFIGRVNLPSGFPHSPVIDACSAVGDITLTTGGSGVVKVGGFLGNAVNDTGGTSVYLTVQNSFYEAGVIEVTTSGTVSPAWGESTNVGGFLGYNSGYIKITGCRSGAAKVQAKRDIISSSSSTNGMIRVGGFSGGHFGGDLEGCFSSALVVVPEGNRSNLANAGGFAGTLEKATGSSIAVSLSGAFATGDVIAYQAENAGGLVGYAVRAGEITRCYATGAVSGNAHHAGGLVGSVDNYHTAVDKTPITISNCYALGNVEGDRRVGGLIGFFDYGTVEHCFAGGTVTASNSTITTDGVHAGGLVGANDSISGNDTLTLKNCVAAGAGVTALMDNGIGDRTAGRVVGKLVSPGSVTNNYALNTMRVESDTWVNRYNPNIKTITSGATTGEGADLAASFLRNQNFWMGIGFNAATWDFSRVVSEGYPRLVGLGGQ